MLYKSVFSKYIHPMSPIPAALGRRGALVKKMKGFLFDVYGTLLISGAGDIGSHGFGHESSNLNGLFLGHHLKDPVDTLQNRFTRAIQAQHDTMKQNGIDYPEVRIEDIWMKVAGFKTLDEAREFSLAYELIINPVYPMPNMIKLLDTCRRRNLLMGMISNAQFYTPLLFEWFLDKGLTDIGFHPDLSIFSYQHGYAKPSLFLFNMAGKRLERLGVAPDQILYIGNDMLNDIMPAKTAGFNTALFAGDARSLRLRKDDPQCLTATPDIVITDLAQLLAYV